MFMKRVLVTLILLPIGLALIVIGGWAFAGLVAVILALAAWEFARLFHAGDFVPATVLVVAGALTLAIGRAIDGFTSAPWLVSLLILLAMTVHLVDYERGRDQAASDFAITLAGIFYIGWLGAYLISVRDLPDGMWWLLIILPIVWLADSAAYLVGSRIGRHKMTKRLSPKKSWEGYFGGVAAGVLGGAALAALIQALALPGGSITWPRGALLGLALSVLTTLGDLGESMIKRQVGMKDSGNLLPGHGGVFDRIDSWLWAGVIGFYMITWLWL
jgi:phosphatidate cytidylyltransferase